MVAVSDPFAICSVDTGHTHGVPEGRGTWNVDGKEFEAGAGDILVVKAGEIHSFKCTEAPLVQLDIHLSPRFIQENLSP